MTGDARVLAAVVGDALTSRQAALAGTPTVGPDARRAVNLSTSLLAAAEGALAVAEGWLRDADADWAEAHVTELGPTHTMLTASAYERESKATQLLQAMAKGLGIRTP